jgi:hypothetical protein
MSESIPALDGADQFAITVSDGFEAWLGEQRASLVFATPPAKIFLVGLDPHGELSVYERTFNKCMGIAEVETQTVYLGTRHEVWRLDNVLRPGELTDDGYDRLFVPLRTWSTGYLNTHDLGVEADGRVVLVNTRFGCPLTDSHYAGAVQANYLQGMGITCDHPAGYTQTGQSVGYAGPGDPGGYPYYSKTG